MKVTLIAKFKNGYLQEAADKVGGYPQLAKYLDVSYPRLIGWATFKEVLSKKVLETPKYKEVERRLCALTGAIFDDVFPEEVRKAYRNVRAVKVTRDVEMLSLTDVANRLMLPPAQEDDIASRELKEEVSKALSTLTPRQAGVLSRRFGLDGGEEMELQEIGKEFNLSTGRIRQIEDRALCRLRHKSKSKNLRPFINNYEEDYLDI